MPSPQQTSTTPPDVRDEWRTPPFVFEFLHRRHRFDIDLAATKENALLPCEYLTAADNALTHEWGRIATAGYLNPPYSNVDPWLEKAIEEARRGFTTVCLLPAPNGEDRYGRFVFDAASEVLFITGRLSFLDPQGRPKSGNNRGSIVVTYRGLDLGHTRYQHIERDAMREAPA